MTAGYAYRRALVTGASDGLGEHFARELARRGADLVLVSRRADELERVAAAVRADHGVRVDTLAADLTEPAGLALVEERLAADGEPIELLVNNAGVFGGITPLGGRDLAELDHGVRLNVLAVVRLTRAALPGMVRRRHGGVLNLSSVAGFMTPPGGAAYSAAKAFVISFTRTAALEVSGLGVHLTALCPGSVRAGAMKDARTRLGPVLEPERVVREGLDAVGAGRVLHVPGLEYRLRVFLARRAPEPVVKWLFHRGWGGRNAVALAQRVETSGVNR
ncbi:SDR family NAD(P)-dependent oxidoreductase [Asanoa sp. WMMD1127]|uniref:SDR family NAD(P)-dependent oxidoreductase n=1 Tax=Asanoa sp. WMMD1127 TaxID=3016107 RepID=UPI00241737BA|nr:SDR family NAD(P)-dependent oxidoreductase [Asanoa sp. WMMD1127]MDG4820743.1 SDR family NAD(P)-dependent oxidoreductase [Asanoa sp. WMMD1127]